MDNDRLLKLKVVAMVAVMLEESTGDYLQTSPQRDPGSEWSVDHRRVAIGRRSLSNFKSKRSSSR